MSDEHKTCEYRNTLEGRYANYFEVGHNAFEFILDFGQLYSDGEEPQLHARIVTSPAYVKAFLETLRTSIDQFECTYGMISKNAQ